MPDALTQARDERLVEPGQLYFTGRPVTIRIRRRGRRLDLDDLGAAVELAGRPGGWLPVAQRVVAETGMNVNRAGVVFVPAFEHSPNLDSLVRRLSEASKAVYAELLELD